MRKLTIFRSMLLSLMTTGLIMTGFSITTGKKQDMVVVCHVEKAFDYRQTIRVPISALKDHIDHGDEVGFCPVKRAPREVSPLGKTRP